VIHSTFGSNASGTLSESSIAEGSEPPVDLVVLTTNVTPEEVAAVTAVINGAIAEELDRNDDEDGDGETQWMKTRRPLRATPDPGPGAWRHG
jgi:hypothetical protein